jgi:glycosyltransferase involved in cell wall biosynthesis
VRNAVFRALQLAVAPFGVGVSAAVALREARRTRARRRAGESPRLLYGVTPIISLKYMSEAMRARGFRTHTFVRGVAAINEKSDFDASVDDLFGKGPFAVKARVLLGPYVALCRALSKGDVFHYFFDGGYLAGTPARFLEARLLHLARKKLIVMPYGGDVAVPSRLRSDAWRNAFLSDYPELGEPRRERETTRRLRHFARHADFVVACLVHFETLPRWDLLTTHYYPIDTEEWAPRAVERDGPFVVFHASNHRALKGTEHVVAACSELAAEGVDIELVLAEGLPNARVRQLLEGCDVVAEQFILGYALTAMEGMALGKPVLSNLSDDWYYEQFRAHTGLDRCPILVTPPERLKETLRRLAADETQRREQGEATRRYVVAHHGYEAVARMWEEIYATVWHGAPLRSSYWNPIETAPADDRSMDVIRGTA